MAKALAEQLAELATLAAADLRVRWETAFKRPAPRRISRDLLLRALAYHVQQQAEGGLSKAARRRLARRAKPNANDDRPARPAVSKPRPGTRLVREWRGEVYRVSVLEGGFEYRGERYTSLSRIAREITGTRWSGPLFFGLRTAHRAKVLSDAR